MALGTFSTNDVQITSFAFRNNGDERRFQSYPRKLVYAGREYVLADQ